MLNVDDFVFKSKASEVLFKHSLKYIQIAKPNDLCIVSPSICRDEPFIKYTAEIKKITHKNWILHPQTHPRGINLIQAVMQDKALVSKIKELCQKSYIIIPLIYTKDFVALSKLCGNKLLNNVSAIKNANNKLTFKRLCKKFDITTIAPVLEKKDNRLKFFSDINLDELYLLRRPLSAGGYGNVKGKILDLMPFMKRYYKEGISSLFIERFKDIFKTLGSLCILKNDEIIFVGIDEQIIHKEAWEGCRFPVTKFDEKILSEVKEKSLLLANYYHKKGIRGQINLDWAIRKKEGKLHLRALECNSRYNGFGLCLRLSSTVFNISREKLYFYLNTNMVLPLQSTTSSIVEIIKKINNNLQFEGGIVLVHAVSKNRGGFCFMATNNKNVSFLRKTLREELRIY
jgi:hypothetical protein